ncbi:MAG: response regulator [Candidatus Curtissbacteria bacterium]|nr:response regulator [Candidatus Curtissbacteria bacterium]
MAKVLLVEDDQFLQKMYQKKFQISGFEVEIAKDGEEGLSKMKALKPDIVLMDIMMPKLNGIDATAAAKSDETTRNIPIIILTNLSSTEDAQTAVKKGAVDFMVKSNFTPAQVVEKVKQVLASGK